MGVDEGNLQVIYIYIEVIVKKNLMILLYGTYIRTSSAYGVYNSHYILHL